MSIDNKFINELARQLRKKSTKSEQRLWYALRNRKFYGLKFLRQHPIIWHDYQRSSFFIADFYCAERNLIIEIDGAIHELQKDYDKERDNIMKQMNLKILRIKNEEFMANR